MPRASADAAAMPLPAEYIAHAARNKVVGTDDRKDRCMMPPDAAAAERVGDWEVEERVEERQARCLA